MTSMKFTPDLTGTMAVYSRAKDEPRDRYGSNERRRRVVAWDDQGRALVKCGDRLYPAPSAPFADCRAFEYLDKPGIYEDRPLVDALTLNLIPEDTFLAVQRGAQESLDSSEDRVVAAIKEATTEVLDSWKSDIIAAIRDAHRSNGEGDEAASGS